MKDNLKDVGVWGQRHYDYLKTTKPSVIGVMRLNGSLNSYLQQINEQAVIISSIAVFYIIMTIFDYT